MTTTSRPSVLFLCIHNADRSQMAAGWLRDLAGDTIDARSVESAPRDQINPVAVTAMAEVGIDITAGIPKKLDWDLAKAPMSSSLSATATPARSSLADATTPAVPARAVSGRTPTTTSTTSTVSANGAT